MLLSAYPDLVCHPSPLPPSSIKLLIALFDQFLPRCSRTKRRTRLISNEKKKNALESVLYVRVVPTS